MSNKQVKSNFSKVYNDYLEYSSTRHKKQGFETSTRNFRLHILPYFENRNISDLKKQDIINWQTMILSKKYSNSFNNSLYYEFSTFIKYCINYDYISDNIVLQVGKFPKKNEVLEHNVYTIHEFRKFRRHLEDNILKQYFNFMYFYGTRPSEALALRFCDFSDFEVHITHSLQRRGNRDLDTPKNQSSIRYFKISSLTWYRIYKLKKYYTKKYGTFDRNYFIFGGKKPLSTTTIDRKKKLACEKANMNEITQHEFRHSYATRAIHNGKNIDEVSRNMGHNKVSTTTDIYLQQEKRMHKHSLIRINF